MQIQTSKLLLMIASILLTSCALEPRVVLVPPIVYVEGVPSDSLKTGPEWRGRVYVYNGTAWELSANKVDIPEGWLLVPPPPHKDN